MEQLSMKTQHEASSRIKLRAGTSNDRDVCSAIMLEAFSAINNLHNFSPEFPDLADWKHMFEVLSSVGYCVVAEMDGRIVGSNFIDERAQVGSVGPISVSPEVQGNGLGRMLMQAVIDRPREQKLAEIRLLQASFNFRSLSLYTKLGFEVQEPIVAMEGIPLKRRSVPGCTVRPASIADLPAVNTICRKVYGFDRALDMQSAIQRGDAFAVERDGRLTGYATGFGYFSHAVAESNLDMQALLCAAHKVDGPGVLIPTRNSELFRWCLESRMRVVLPYTYMSMGSYAAPQGAFIPSIGF